MAQTFRFSVRPNRAHEIQWRNWGPDAFAPDDRLRFLQITTTWCRECDVMDEAALSDPAVIALLNDHFVPIRVDGDRMPHVQDRYVAGGWPTSAFLAPTGEVLWSATHATAEQLQQVGASVLAAWEQRRDELKLEIERRGRALEASRANHAAVGLVRREAADDVLSAIRETFDARNGGFGDAPKFPEPDAIELLYFDAQRGDEDAGRMADYTLDGMLAGELRDAVAGGFFRYALNADWTAPRCEKLLSVNAGLLRVYALGASNRGRGDWADTARGIVAWVDGTLQRGTLWASSQADDETYWSLTADERARTAAPHVDDTIYTGWNARWIAALARAGALLQEPAWCARAESALRALSEQMEAPEGLYYHYCAAGEEPQSPILLHDVLEVGRACLAIAAVSDDGAWIERARACAHTIERCFWANEAGGFWDRVRSGDDVGVLRYRDRPFDVNADAARFLLDLARCTDDRGCRARAERVLALLSPRAGRFGVAGAPFALAVEEYFESGRRR